MSDSIDTTVYFKNHVSDLLSILFNQLLNIICFNKVLIVVKIQFID